MIYIHIPFCRSFCTYCDFYSEVAARCREKEDEQKSMFGRFSQALGREIALRADEMSDEYNTIYIGGGTPSVLPLDVYSDIVGRLADAGIRPPFKEFTFEVNPEDVVEMGEAYIRGLMELGVNRFSMGVQSFDDGILKWMNRRHDSAVARRAYSIMEKAGVGNISIDLIFGLPQMSDDLWRDTLRQALDISPSGKLPRHISAYQLSVEPGSALAVMVQKGEWSEAADELCARQYDILCEELSKAGYHHYEISNFAQPGYEAKHNSAYWHHVPYVGLGPGAHSFLITQSPGADSYRPRYRRRWNEPDLKKYIVDQEECTDGEELTTEQVSMEHIMLGLRTSRGIPEQYLREHCDRQALSDALSSGDLVVSKDRMIRIPESRFFVSDSIIFSLV